MPAIPDERCIYEVSCMRILFFDKKKLFSFFFFFYFVVYAISPLTYTVAEKRAFESRFASAKASSSIKSIHVFLWELIVKRVATREEPAQDHAGDTIIVRKKRALLPENAAAKLLSFDAATLAEDRYVPPPRTNVRVLKSVTFQSTRKGFSSLYAGHAPPVG
jgi:hypothetical protein